MDLLQPILLSRKAVLLCHGESDYEFPFCLRIPICIRGAHAHKQRSRKLINDPYTIREKLPSYSKPYHKGLKQGALFVISEKNKDRIDSNCNCNGSLSKVLSWRGANHEKKIHVNHKSRETSKVSSLVYPISPPNLTNASLIFLAAENKYNSANVFLSQHPVGTAV